MVKIRKPLSYRIDKDKNDKKASVNDIVLAKVPKDADQMSLVEGEAETA